MEKELMEKCLDLKEELWAKRVAAGLLLTPF